MGQLKLKLQFCFGILEWSGIEKSIEKEKIYNYSKKKETVF